MSELSVKAKKRNWFKLRLMGAVSVFYPNDNVMTDKEMQEIRFIREKIESILLRFNENSRELGLNPSNRCRFCGRKILDDEIICNHCLNR